MAQLRLGYPEMKQRKAEVLWITATPPTQGALYARRFNLPFPYLCDGDGAVHRLYGFSTKGILAGLRGAAKSTPAILRGMASGEQPSVVPYISKMLTEATMDHAMFLVGQDGRVHFRHIAAPRTHLPSNDALIGALDKLP